jgi:ACR3 family arsenite transporter
MVMVWNQLAKGHPDYCAVLVVLNSVLQVALYAPYSLLLINVIGGGGAQIHVSYKDVALSVLIYLGIPLLAGVVTRYAVWGVTSRSFLERTFLPRFGPLALIGLLYTIVVMFAYQGHHIVRNLGPVFRVFVPMILYFLIMWSGAFALVWWLGRREARRGRPDPAYRYDMAVVQSFTAGSNNFVRVASVLSCWFSRVSAGAGHRRRNRRLWVSALGVHRELYSHIDSVSTRTRRWRRPSGPSSRYQFCLR